MQGLCAFSQPPKTGLLSTALQLKVGSCQGQVPVHLGCVTLQWGCAEFVALLVMQSCLYSVMSVHYLGHVHVEGKDAEQQGGDMQLPSKHTIFFRFAHSCYHGHKSRINSF